MRIDVYDYNIIYMIIYVRANVCKCHLGSLFNETSDLWIGGLFGCPTLQKGVYQTRGCHNSWERIFLHMHTYTFPYIYAHLARMYPGNFRNEYKYCSAMSDKGRLYHFLFFSLRDFPAEKRPPVQRWKWSLSKGISPIMSILYIKHFFPSYYDTFQVNFLTLEKH